MSRLKGTDIVGEVFDPISKELIQNVRLSELKEYFNPKAPKQQPLTKKELIAKADSLGLNWDYKQKKMKNSDMEALIAEAEK